VQRSETVGNLAASKSQTQPGRVLVFVPSFNDSAALPELVSGINELGPRYQALVIDDGSSKSVLSEALAGECLHARLPSNFGLGVCTYVAFRHALQHGYQTVARIDGDGQHRVADIPELIKTLEEGDLDLVAGVRVNQNRELGSFGRRFVKFYFNGFARWITGGCAPQDVNTGFFAANTDAMELIIHTTLERFPESELYISACIAGLKVGSAPIEQLDRLEGRSTIHVVGGLRIFFRFNVFAFGQIVRKFLP